VLRDAGSLFWGGKSAWIRTRRVSVLLVHIHGRGAALRSPACHDRYRRARGFRLV
jgi:hypothetical protein